MRKTITSLAPKNTTRAAASIRRTMHNPALVGLSLSPRLQALQSHKPRISNNLPSLLTARIESSFGASQPANWNGRQETRKERIQGTKSGATRRTSPSPSTLSPDVEAWVRRRVADWAPDTRRSPARSLPPPGFAPPPRCSTRACLRREALVLSWPLARQRGLWVPSTTLV